MTQGKPLTEKQRQDPVTKGDLEVLATDITNRLDGVVGELKENTKEKVNAAEERLAESIRSINFSLAEHLARMEGKLDYIAQNASLRQELRNLVSQLKDQGLKLDESKIFVV